MRAEGNQGFGYMLVEFKMLSTIQLQRRPACYKQALSGQLTSLIIGYINALEVLAILTYFVSK